MHLNITVQLWSVSSLWDLYSILYGISIFCDTIDEWAFLPILIMPLSILLLFSFLLLWVIGRWRRGRVVAALRVGKTCHCVMKNPPNFIYFLLSHYISLPWTHLLAFPLNFTLFRTQFLIFSLTMIPKGNIRMIKRKKKGGGCGQSKEIRIE